MPGRRSNSSTIRYGYQGSEKDDEFKGEGNHYTTRFRQLDPRLSSWWSVDPKPDPSSSPYNSMDNNPIRYNDILGLYTEKRAKRLAEKGEKKGYDTKVVENKNIKKGFGVYYEKTDSEGIKRFDTYFSGKFKGANKIAKASGGSVENLGVVGPDYSSLSSINNNGPNNKDHYVGYYYEYAAFSLFSGGGSVGTVVTAHHGTHTYQSNATYDSGFQAKSELFSLGGGYGFIISTGPASEVPLSAIEGFSKSIELNASAVVVDVGGKISWSSVPYNDKGDILIMFGNQLSIGVSTPAVSGGFTQSNTNIRK